MSYNDYKKFTTKINMFKKIDNIEDDVGIKFEAISEGIGLGTLKSILSEQNDDQAQNKMNKYSTQQNQFISSSDSPDINWNTYSADNITMNNFFDINKNFKSEVSFTYGLYVKMLRFFIGHLIDLVFISCSTIVIIMFMNILLLNNKTISLNNIFYFLSMENLFGSYWLYLIFLIYGLFVLYFVFFKIFFKYTLGQSVLLKLTQRKYAKSL